MGTCNGLCPPKIYLIPTPSPGSVVLFGGGNFAEVIKNLKTRAFWKEGGSYSPRLGSP